MSEGQWGTFLQKINIPMFSCVVTDSVGVLEQSQLCQEQEVVQIRGETFNFLIF